MSAYKANLARLGDLQRRAQRRADEPVAQRVRHRRRILPQAVVARYLHYRAAGPGRGHSEAVSLALHHEQR